jgi:hypothetical protein
VARRPAVRANNARDYFDFFERAYPALHRHLKETLPPEVLERIEKGLRTDWIPVTLDVQFVDAVVAYLGVEGTKKACRRFVVEALVKSPMMRELFDGVVRLFGVSIGGFLRIVPPALGQSYQDSMTLIVERGKQDTLVIFDDIAPELLRSPSYGIIWEGIFLGLYDLAKVPPQLDFKISRAQRRMEARFRW